MHRMQHKEAASVMCMRILVFIEEIDVNVHHGEIINHHN